MNKLSITLFVCAVMPVLSFGQNTTRYELDVKEFNELKVTDGINVN